MNVQLTLKTTFTTIPLFKVGNGNEESIHATTITTTKPQINNINIKGRTESTFKFNYNLPDTEAQ